MARRGLVAAAITLALSVGAADAGAALTCGQTMTKDRKLKADLKNCPGDGLLIGAAGVTIDLNGHTIGGVGAGGTAGLSNATGFNDTRIKGPGTIKSFDHGVELLNGADARVSRVTVKDSGVTGIYSNSTDGARFKRNVISDSESWGIQVTHTDDADVIGNEITGPASSGSSNTGISVNASDSSNILVEDNVVRGGGDGDWGILVNGSAPGTRVKGNDVRRMQQHGIEVYDGAVDTLVKNNTTARNGIDGIRVAGNAGAGNRVLGNASTANDGDGIELALTGVEAADNSAVGNDGWGILAVAGVVDGGGNSASGNGLGQCSASISC